MYFQTKLTPLFYPPHNVLRQSMPPDAQGMPVISCLAPGKLKIDNDFGERLAGTTVVISVKYVCNLMALYD